MGLRISAIVLTALTLAVSLASESLLAGDLSGCWAGSWQSCTTGHSGPLRAEFTRCDDDSYRVKFTGRFFKVVPFKYTVTLDVISEDAEGVVLAGSSYLGRMFGTFTYRASADDCRFTANYSSKKDSGMFRLTRQGS
jgi:hypothetical protein